MKNKIKIISLLYCVFIVACHKKALLNVVPSNSHNVLSTLDECQQLLDKEVTLNTSPILGESSSDCYYLKDEIWQNLNPKEKNAYVWAPNIFENAVNDDDWTTGYQQVYTSNVVLEGLNAIPVTAANKIQYDGIKGAALFFRSYALYNLAQEFAMPYDNVTAHLSPGIPLRLIPYIEEVSKRATIRETYDQIITDLKEAKILLPVNFDAVHRNRPSAVAALAMLARVYLSMGDYNHAFLYADSCLRIYNTLMDYNTLNTAAVYPFHRTNAETLYQTRFHAATDVMLGYAKKRCIVDSFLYRSYEANDLRRELYFIIHSDGLTYPKGSYFGTYEPFSGLATDEIYFIRAECYARDKDIQSAIGDINTVMKNRYKTGTFIPYIANSAEDALRIVLDERKKELVFRGTRWTDIRRLSKEGTGITLTRKINNQVYQLLPGDKRYALPIPSDVIKRSGMQQNPR